METIDTAVIGGGVVGLAAALAIASAYAQFVEDCWDQNYKIVVPTTSSGGTFAPELEGDWRIVPARTLQAVTGVRIDDVVDSHRNRRFKSALFRHTLPV